MTPTVAKVIKKFEIDLQNAFKEDKIRSMFTGLDLTPKHINFHKLFLESSGHTKIEFSEDFC